MIEYWLNMDPTMKVFVGIGTISGLALTIQMILSMLGGAVEGVDGDFDIGEGGEGGATGILSIRSIGAFFTGFGWAGAASTFFWVDPDKQITGVIMTQFIGSNYLLADDMMTAFYGSLRTE